MALEHPVGALHLRPATDLAERVLLPGDPRRALVVAQSLLERPLMFNHARGLWGYTGLAPDGRPLTVQATGMGGPSAAIVCEELIALGARRLVRIGTCGALDSSLALEDLIAAREVIPGDGTSRALGADGRLRPDEGLTSALVAAGAAPATVVSTDLFYDPRSVAERWRGAGAGAVEMEAAALLAVAERRQTAAACLLAVTDVPGPQGAVRLGAEALEAVGVRMAEVALVALAPETG